jgi:2-keto-4-pentenoate hydratase/2-oxohepta-3-ene-1,7-dioic acid hydratase in catechol pathway
VRIARFSVDDEPRYGVVETDDPEGLVGTVSVLDSDPLYRPVQFTGEKLQLADVRLLAPVIPRSKVVGVGRNYAAHAAELGNVLPTKPLVFMKLPTSSVPPSGPVLCPQVVEQLDYEAELVVVIGGGGTIAGWAVGDDVSARDLQDSEEQWTRAKGFDASCPWGPWITTVDELADARGLRIQSWVNGEQRQDANTQDLIYGPEQLVDFIAETCTLEPGDIILTGTPEGVGKAFDPPRYLSEGDVVRVEIERLGSIEHPVSARR